MKDKVYSIEDHDEDHPCTVSELIEILQAIEADGYGDCVCTVEGGCVGLDGIIEVWPKKKEVEIE